MRRLIAKFRSPSPPPRLTSEPEPGLLREPWLQPYPPTASKADILACFRLLLGRYPHAEEWQGHSMHVGDNLPEVVASYLKSLEFSRRGLIDQDVPAEIVVADLADFRILVDVNDGAVGRHVRADCYEADVTAVFRRQLKPGMGVIDIGANIGYFSMLSASLVGETGHVYAVEPNQQNAKLLEASRRLNGFGQITLLNVAAGAVMGVLALHTSHSTGTTSNLPEEVGALLAARVVPSMALDRLIPAERRIDLIKVDVDGSEFPAMRGCQAIVRRDRPVVVSEFGPTMMPRDPGMGGEDYLRWYAAQGYDVAVIRPDGSLSPKTQDPASVMDAFHRSGVDHIDIVATPREAS